MILAISILTCGILFGIIISHLTNYIPFKLNQEWKAQANEILYGNLFSEKLKKTPSTRRKIFICLIFTIIALTNYLHTFSTNNTVCFLLINLFSLLLLSASIIDLENRIIPDSISFPLILVGLLSNQQELFCSLENAVFGAIFGYLLLFSIAEIFKITTKKEGLGHGDCKLLAALGAWIGWEALPHILWLAAFLGCLHWSIYTLKSKQGKLYIPFGPSLSIAGWVSILKIGLI